MGDRLIPRRGAYAAGGYGNSVQPSSRRPQCGGVPTSARAGNAANVEASECAAAEWPFGTGISAEVQRNARARLIGTEKQRGGFGSGRIVWRHFLRAVQGGNEECGLFAADLVHSAVGI